MASSSAPNIFSASMSFSRDTCRITDGSMFIGPFVLLCRNLTPAGSDPGTISSAALRPLEFQSCEPNIAETDIIGFAVLPINDAEPISVDALQCSAQISTPRTGRTVGGLGKHGHVALHAHAAADEPAGVIERIELAVEARGRNLELVTVADLVGCVQDRRRLSRDGLAILDRDGTPVFALEHETDDRRPSAAGRLDRQKAAAFLPRDRPDLLGRLHFQELHSPTYEEQKSGPAPATISSRAASVYQMRGRAATDGPRLPPGSVPGCGPETENPPAASRVREKGNFRASDTTCSRSSKKGRSSSRSSERS